MPGAAEEPQGPEEAVLCEVKGDDDTAFPALPPVSYEQRVS